MGFTRFLPYDRKPMRRSIPWSGPLPYACDACRRPAGARRRRSARCCGSGPRARSRCWSLPGGYLEPGLALDDSIRSQLARKVDVAELSWLEQLETVGDPAAIRPSGSSPPPIWASCRSDSTRPSPADTGWHPVERLPEPMAFDHEAIVLAGRERLRAKLSYTNIGFALAPDSFSISELSSIYTPRSATRSTRPTCAECSSAAACSRPPASAARPAAAVGGPAAVYRFGSRDLAVTDPFAVLRPLARAALARIEQQAEVERRRRVRERADADEVDARLGNPTDRVERDAPARLELGAPGHELDRPAQFGGVHVVEQDPRHARVDGRPDLVERGALDLDHHPGRRFASARSDASPTPPAARSGSP